MSWFKKTHFGFKLSLRPRRETPDGLWRKCDGCGEILYTKDLEQNLRVCSKCGHHFRMSARNYIGFLTDPATFEELYAGITSTDPLGFRDTKRYTDRLRENRRATGLSESVVTGRARVGGHPVALAVMDFAFLGGTLGSATGEKVGRTINLALRERMPLIIVSTSGGARMQEGILSLMQMAKTSVGLAELADEGVPFISILVDPTTAGVAASYAALGDIIIAEPGAMVGFAGPRVIEQTIHQELPPGFQRADFVLEHGMVDMIVSRRDMRERVARLLDLLIERVKRPEPGPGAEAGRGAGPRFGGEPGRVGWIRAAGPGSAAERARAGERSRRHGGPSPVKG